MSQDPSTLPTALQVAAGLIAAGRATEAARELNALVRAAPTYAAAYVLLAKAREATDDRVRALDAWHRAYFLVPSSPLVRRERQRLLDTLVPPAAPAAEMAQVQPAEPLAQPTLPARPPVPEADSEASGGTSRAESPEDESNGEPSAPILPPLLEDAEADDTAAPETRTDGWTRTQSTDTEYLPPLAPIETRPVEAETLEAGVPEDLAPEDDALEDVAPEAAGDAVPGALPGMDGLDNDLDALIRDLEHAPRIRPDPDFKGPDALASGNQTEEIASETLAQIYAAQEKYAEAASVYETLARHKPHREAEMHRLADEMRGRAAQ